MKVFIFTQPHDEHAVMVQHALKTMDHDVRLFFGADQPSQLGHSIWIDEDQLSWKSTDVQTPHAFDDYDVVWHRRLQKPRVPRHRLHPEDYEFSCRENLLFFDALTPLMAKHGWWINPPHAVKRANTKLYQLQLARAIGLMIPRTLCSNCPVDIRAFIKKYQKYGVIYKPLCPGFWFEEGHQTRISYTSLVTLKQLPKDDLLQLTPGIFQPFIRKKYELRVTCFGSHCVAVKIHSQESKWGKWDWRCMPDETLKLSPYALPKSVEFQLRALMKALGVVFGCIDMIVTPEGDYVFLEINEQGQFLWIEDYVPETRLLDRFIQFILNRNFYFQWNHSGMFHKVTDYASSTESQLAKQLETHVDTRIKKEKLCVNG